MICETGGAHFLMISWYGVARSLIWRGSWYISTPEQFQMVVLPGSMVGFLALVVVGPSCNRDENGRLYLIRIGPQIMCYYKGNRSSERSPADTHLEQSTNYIHIIEPRVCAFSVLLTLNVVQSIPEMPDDHLWCLNAFDETWRGTL